MADPYDLIASYITGNSTPADKQYSVDAASTVKKSVLNGVGPNQEYYDAAVARRTGQGLLGNDQRTQDLRTMGDLDLLLKYGQTGAEMLRGLSIGSQAYENDRTIPRTNTQRANDVVVDVGRAAVNGPLGIVALGTGLVDDQTGAAVSGLMQDWNTYSDQQQSRSLNAQRRAVQTESRLAADDNRVQMQQEIASGDSQSSANIRRIGRDVLDSAWINGSNPATLTSGAAQGVGSLLSGSIIGSGIKTAITKILSTVGSGSSPLGFAIADHIGTEIAMPLSIMAQESGGVYTGTVNQVMAMSFEELQQASPEYRKLRASGSTPEAARIEVAGKAGKIAAAITAPVAYASGKLVAGFEAEPFAVATFRQAGKNILKEGIEEFTQSGSGQLAQNIGVQQTADSNQNLTEGVGDQAVQGALSGSLSAGVTQAPGIALRGSLRAAREGGKLIVGGAVAATAALLDLGDKRLAKAAIESPVSSETIRAETAEAVRTTPEFVTNLQEAIAAAPVEDQTAAMSYAESLIATTAMTDQDLVNEPEILRTVLSGSTDVFDSMSRAAEIAGDTERSGADRLTAGLYILNKGRQTSALLTEDLPNALIGLPADHPAVAQLGRFESIIKSLHSNPQVVDAIRAAANLPVTISPEDVSEAAVDTPAGQQAVYNAVGLAEQMPHKVDPEINDIILSHAYLGKIILTPAQVQALETTSALAREGQKAKLVQEKLKLRRIDIVTKQATTDLEGKDAYQPSAAQHVLDVIHAMAIGRPDIAKVRLESFVNFARSMQNKVMALNESMANKGMKIGYKAKDPLTVDQFYEAKPIWLNPLDSTSVLTGQEIALNAKFVGDMATKMVNIYKDLKVVPPAMATLNLPMDLPAREVVKNYKEQRRAQKRSIDPVVQTKAPEPVVAPVVDPVVDKVALTERTARLMVDTAFNDLKKAYPQIYEGTVLTNEQRLRAAALLVDGTYDKANTAVLIALSEQIAKSEAKASEQTTAVEPTVQPVAEKPAVEQVVEEVTPKKEVTSQPEATQPEQSAAEPPAQPVVSADVAPAVVENTEQEKPKLFPNLLGGLFIASFKIPQERISNLVGLASPLQFVLDAFKSRQAFQDAFQGLASKKLSKSVSDDFIQAYGTHLKKLVDIEKGLKTRMAQFLSEPVVKDSPNSPTVLQALKDNGLPARWIRGKVLNLVDETNYNQELLQQALLAGFSWLATADSQARIYTKKQAGRILGKAEYEVTTADLKFLNLSIPVSNAVETLAEKIADYWGVTKNREAPLGYVRGITEAMAREVIVGLMETKIITEESYTIQDDINRRPKTLKNIKFYRDEEFQSALHDIRSFPSALDQLALVNPEDADFINELPPEPSKTQLRNPLVRNTAQQLQSIDHHQKTKHYVNVPLVDLLRSMGRTNAKNLFGGGETDIRKLNKNHKATLQGRNVTLLGAYDKMTGLYDRIRDSEDVLSGLSDVSKTPIHYAYNVARNGRLHMLGLHNPQSNKLSRELVLPTWSVVDLTQPQNKERFLLTIAQAMGEKVNELFRDEAVAKAVNNLEQPNYANVVKLLKDWLEGGFDLTAEDMAVLDLKDSKGKRLITPVLLHALMEYARFEMAGPAEQARFRTAMYLEADGVTDGAINAMVHLTTGNFTPKWVKTIAKGGLFLGASGRTLAQHRKEDKEDLYASIKSVYASVRAEVMKSLGSNTKVKDHYDALSRVMDTLLPDVTFDPETSELTIGRNTVKNPLTVVIYQGGNKGIAGKVTEAILDSLYEKMSEIAQAREDRTLTAAEVLFGDKVTSDTTADQLFAQFTADMNVIQNTVLKTGKHGKYLVTPEPKDNKRVKYGPEEFTIEGQDYTNLVENVMRMFVEPLSAAIKETMGDITPATDAIRKATQIQSIFSRYAFRREIDRMIAAKAKANAEFKNEDGNPNSENAPKFGHEFLSQAELDEVYKRHRHIAPFVKLENMEFLFGASERSELEMKQWASGIRGELRTDVSIMGPGKLGVGAVPLLVIGPGDGQMVQNAATMPDAPTRQLPVFDGIHMPIDEIDTASVKINQAVYDGWMVNTLAYVSESYSDFIRDVSMDSVDAEQMKELAEVLFGTSASAMSAAQTLESVKRHEVVLIKLSNSAQARHNTMAKYEMTVDHMAGAQNPYVSPGESLDGLDEDQILQRLTTTYDEELAKLNNEKPPLTDMTKELIALGSKAETGVAVFEPYSLLSVLKALDIPQDQKQLLWPSLRALKDKGFSIVLGSLSQLDEYIAKNNLKRPLELSTAEGVMVMSDQMIYLKNGSSETILHELIHAATLDKVYTALSDPESSTPETRDAVSRIEGLMLEWLGIEPEINEFSAKIRNEYAEAKRTVELWLNNTENLSAVKRAAAINEFMAWNLSNQDLINLNKRIEVKNPLLLIIGKALKALKELIWGEKKAPFVGKDLYSNLRFNAAILMQEQRPVPKMVSDVVMYQSRSFGQSDRLSDIRQKFMEKVAVLVNEAPSPYAAHVKQYDIVYMGQRGADVMASMQAHGFPMNQQEDSTFQQIMYGFLVDAYLHPGALRGVQELYAHVTKNLTVEDFMVDTALNDPADRYQAQQKFDVLTGAVTVKEDRHGRSTLLPAFLALSVVSDEFRAILNKMPMPVTQKGPNNTLDGLASNVGNETMQRLSDAMSGMNRKAPNTLAAIDFLTQKLADTAEQDSNFIITAARQPSLLINRVNDWAVDGIQKASQKVYDKAVANENSSNKLVRATATAGKLISGIVNEELSGEVAKGLMSLIDKTGLWRPIHEIINEVVGRTQQIGSVYDMIKAVRSVAQQLRQQFREEVPQIIAKKFSRELTDAEWANLHRSMAMTDLSSLKPSFTNAEIISMLGDSLKVDAEILRLEGRLRQSEGGRSQALIKKSKELADFMMLRKVSGNLLRNAHAVAALFNESEALAKGKEPDARLVTDVDQLTTLYALQIAQKDNQSLTDLSGSEQTGIDFALSYLSGQRVGEQSKVSSVRARNNHYKGYAPSEAEQGYSLEIMNDSEFMNMKLKGYERVGDYIGSGSERGSGKKSYYFSKVSGRSTFNQGIIQNVRPTASGVDPVSGFTYGTNMVAGRITDQTEVAQIKRLRALNEKATEPLMPIFDEQNNVVAYERSVAPEQEAKLNRNQHFGEVLGAWRGRQAEEAMAVENNKLLIERLHDQWVEAVKNKHTDEYVDLYDALSKDPVLGDAVALFTPETKVFIKARFGEKFMVKRSLINDVVGYRAASVGDIWTGNSRWNSSVRRDVQRAAAAVFGTKAFTYLTRAEKVTQNVVSAARVLIVVKSIVVPVTNIISNIYQLAARGVPLVDIIRMLPAKTAEVDQYVKNRIRTVELEAELRAAGSNPMISRKIETELKSIKDANGRMSIWPLIEANEFSSISEGGITREELALTEGRLADYVETLVDKLPKSVQTAGRYAIVAKDTALFKGLARTVEYGDFLAKAVLYDHLTKVKSVSKADALVKITEEFINYDRLPGRTRGYLESMGVIWFWNFKLRSMKVALSMIRNNPVNALISMLAPAPPFFDSVGLPIEDNFVTLLGEGRLGSSIGPGMALRSPNLIPWINLVN